MDLQMLRIVAISGNIETSGCHFRVPVVRGVANITDWIVRLGSFSCGHGVKPEPKRVIALPAHPPRLNGRPDNRAQ